MKKDIALLDWSTLDVPRLQANHHWVLPQVLAFFNQNLRLERVGGKISSSATLRALHADLLDSRVKFQTGKVAQAEDITNLLQYLRYAPRGDIIYGKQGLPTNVRYSAPVPLLLSALKEYRSVGYEEWDYGDPGIKHVLDKDLYDLIQYKSTDFSDFDLLEIRELGRTVKTGARAGRQTPYASCTAVNGIQDPDFRELPRLLKLMLTQMWLYHPTVRHPLMWTSLQNLDLPAAPLVDQDVLVPPTTETRGKKARESDPLPKLPWQ
jgi:hypothetical protein